MKIKAKAPNATAAKAMLDAIYWLEHSAEYMSETIVEAIDLRVSLELSLPEGGEDYRTIVAIQATGYRTTWETLDLVKRVIGRGKLISVS